MAGSQNPEIINTFDPLSLDEFNSRLPQIGIESITPTYPVNPAWLSVPYFYSYYSNSLNGATISTLASAMGQSFNSPAIQKGLVQYYQSLTIKLSGGSVSPIGFVLSFNDSVTDRVIIEKNLTNPGTYLVSGLLVGSNIDIQLRTTTNGGAPDIIEIMGAGFQARPGLPLLTPSLSQAVLI